MYALMEAVGIIDTHLVDSHVAAPREFGPEPPPASEVNVLS